MNKFLIFAFIIAFVSPNAFGQDECLNVEPMADFDLKRLLDKWYIYQEYNVPDAKDIACGVMVFSLINDTSDVVLYNGLTLYKNESITNETMLIESTSFENGLLQMDKSNTTMIDTDYETYSVWYDCSDEMGGQVITATVSLNLDDNIKSKINQVIQDKIGLDPSLMNYVGREDC